MSTASTGKYTVRLGRDARDIREAQVLRQHCFGVGEKGLDLDDFDATCQHILVTEAQTNQLVCCFRMLLIADGRGVSDSYSAQFYDLKSLATYPGGMAEIGRFCIDPAFSDPDILRVAWAAMTRIVDENQVGLLFGCTSFHGTQAAKYADAFALLHKKHQAPPCWAPRHKAPEIVRFDEMLESPKSNLASAIKGLPTLLRTYLLMGGWVSDHGVVDRDLNTIHVFTGLEIKSIPPTRASLLRADSKMNLNIL